MTRDEQRKAYALKMQDLIRDLFAEQMMTSGQIAKFLTENKVPTSTGHHQWTRAKVEVLTRQIRKHTGEFVIRVQKINPSNPRSGFEDTDRFLGLRPRDAIMDHFEVLKNDRTKALLNEAKAIQ